MDFSLLSVRRLLKAENIAIHRNDVLNYLFAGKLVLFMLGGVFVLGSYFFGYLYVICAKIVTWFVFYVRACKCLSD